MVVAKSEPAYRVLKQAFRDREVDKRYHALVQGHPDPLRGTIDAPLGRHPAGDGRFTVVAGGRPSVTHYDTLEAFRGASLEEIILETGRTHQIRVHMAALRHPCAGDRLYGADPVLAAHLGLTRQWLHAVRLGFRAPGGRPPGGLHQRVLPGPRLRAGHPPRGKLTGHTGRVYFSTKFSTTANTRYISHRPVPRWKKPSARSAGR